MITSLYSKNRKSEEVPLGISPEYKIYQQQQTVENGNLVRKNVVVTVNPSKDNSQFKSSDFSIGNILAVGAIDTLKPVFGTTLSSMNYADQFQQINLTLDETVQTK